MERLTSPIRDVHQRPGNPPPAVSEASEDGGQRYMEDHSRSELSDKYPAGPEASEVGTEGSDDALPKVTLDTKFDVRVTKAERSAMDRRAKSLGVKRSRWTRETLLDALDKRRDGVGILAAASASPPQPGLVQAVEQLRRVGVLLNQERRYQQRFSDDLLNETIAKVNEIRESLGDRTSL